MAREFGPREEFELAAKEHELVQKTQLESGPYGSEELHRFDASSKKLEKMINEGHKDALELKKRHEELIRRVRQAEMDLKGFEVSELEMHA